jgi:hypothetical protein
MLSVCLYVYPPHQVLNSWTNLYKTWYAYHGTWAHLNGILHKSLPVCLLLGNGLVNRLPRQRVHTQKYNCSTRRYLWVRVVSKEISWLVLPRTSCSLFVSSFIVYDVFPFFFLLSIFSLQLLFPYFVSFSSVFLPIARSLFLPCPTWILSRNRIRL